MHSTALLNTNQQCDREVGFGRLCALLMTDFTHTNPYFVVLLMAILSFTGGRRVIGCELSTGEKVQVQMRGQG